MLVGCLEAIGYPPQHPPLVSEQVGQSDIIAWIVLGTSSVRGRWIWKVEWTIVLQHDQPAGMASNESLQ